jgi:hypothetical protein
MVIGQPHGIFENKIIHIILNFAGKKEKKTRSTLEMLSIESSYARYETGTLISENNIQYLNNQCNPGPRCKYSRRLPATGARSLGSNVRYVRKNNYLLARMYQLPARHRSHALSIVI